MNEYVIREGVMLTSILNQNLLVSTSANRQKCAYVKLINSTAAFYWKLMEDRKTINEMAIIASKEFGINDINELICDIKAYIESLKEYGYLLSNEEMAIGNYD